MSDLTKLSGKFIVFDGPEGGGKSTQTRLLAERLRQGGLQVLTVRDPGATPIGEKIRAILLDPENREMAMRCEMLLYMAARAQMMSQHIRPALQSGQVVLCDRFVSSTLAYQLGGENLTEAEIRDVGQTAIDGRWPDLTIILDMDPQTAFARVNRARDRIEQRPLAYHQQVRGNYLRQAAADASYRVVDAARDVAVVQADVWRAVEELAARC